MDVCALAVRYSPVLVSRGIQLVHRSPGVCVRQAPGSPAGSFGPRATVGYGGLLSSAKTNLRDVLPASRKI